MSFRHLCAAASLAVLGCADAAPVDSVERACNRLLNQEPRLHDPLLVLPPSLHSLHLRDWLCQTNFSSHADLIRTTSALNLPDPGLGTLLGYLLPEEPAAFQDAWGEFCRSGYQRQINPAARSHFQRLAASNMSYAYSGCLARRQQEGADFFVYAVPRERSLTDFTIHVRQARGAPPARIATRGAAHCGDAMRSDPASPELRYPCRKPAEQAARISLKTADGTERSLVLPASAELAQWRLDESQLILADRLDALERALSQPGPEQQAEAVHTGEATIACPRGSFVSALAWTAEGARPRCAKLPPSWD